MTSSFIPSRAIFGARAQAAAQLSSTSSTHSSSPTTTSAHSVSYTSSTQTTPTTSVNTSPFFPDPSTVHPPPLAHSDQSNRQLTKNVFEFVLIAFLILITIFLTFKRFRRLQRTNQPLRDFFKFSLPWFNSPAISSPDHTHQQSTQTTPARSYSRTRPRPPSNYVNHDHTDYPNSSLYDDVRYPITASPLDLRSLPLVYSPNGNNRRAPVRRTRAANVDENGRRLDSGWDPDQESLDNKDVLPAYDRYGGPPKYADLELEMEESAGTDRGRGDGDRDGADGQRG